MRKALCPYNGSIEDIKKIEFCDSTLREGELNPGASFTYEEKKQLIRKLDEIGVSEFVVASVGTNNKPDKAQEQYIKEVSEMGLKMGTVFSITGKDSVDFVARYNPTTIRLVAFTSEFLNRGKALTRESFEDNISEVVDMIKYVKAKGIRVSIGLCDSTRANAEWLFEMIEEFAKAGADEISVVDTAGCATPEAMTYLVSNACRILKPFNCTLGVHCHNDFGLALANILAAVKAGATKIDTCINGLGDRCGNASLVEVAGALEFLYGIDSGIKLPKMKELADLTARLSGIPLSGSTPLVGDYAFSHQQNVHIIEYQKEHLAWQGIEAEEVGNETIVIFGKASGPVSIDFESRRKGRNIDKTLYPEILKAVADKAEADKGTVIRSEEFWNIVDKIERK